MKQPLHIIIGISLITIIFPIYIYISVQNKKPSCYAENCIGLDAIKNRCDTDAITIAETKENKMELRYSPRCNASWTRAFITPVGSEIYVQDLNGRQYGNYKVPDDGIKSGHFGNMGPGRKLKACIKLQNKNICTPFST